jgi:hypothetical protein
MKRVVAVEYDASNGTIMTLHHWSDGTTTITFAKLSN